MQVKKSNINEYSFKAYIEKETDDQMINLLCLNCNAKDFLYVVTLIKVETEDKNFIEALKFTNDGNMIGLLVIFKDMVSVLFISFKIDELTEIKSTSEFNKINSNGDNSIFLHKNILDYSHKTFKTFVQNKRNNVCQSKNKLCLISDSPLIYCYLNYLNLLTLIEIIPVRKNIIIKNYKYSGFVIHDLKFLKIENNFTGRDIELLGAVSYDNHTNLINFHKIFLPNLENEIILDHETLAIKTDSIHKLKFICFANELFLNIFCNETIVNIMLFTDDFKVVKEYALFDYPVFVDYYKILTINKEFFVIIQTNNNNLSLFKFNLENINLVWSIQLEEQSINFSLKVISRNEKVFLLRKAFCGNTKIYQINISNESLNKYVESEFNFPFLNKHQSEKFIEGCEELTLKNYSNIHSDISLNYFTIINSCAKLKIEGDYLAHLEDIVVFYDGNVKVLNIKNNTIMFNSEEVLLDLYTDIQKKEINLYFNKRMIIVNKEKILEIDLTDYFNFSINCELNGTKYIFCSNNIFYLNADNKLVRENNFDLKQIKSCKLFSKINNRILLWDSENRNFRLLILSNKILECIEFNCPEISEDIKHINLTANFISVITNYSSFMIYEYKLNQSEVKVKNILNSYIQINCKIEDAKSYLIECKTNNLTLILTYLDFIVKIIELDIVKNSLRNFNFISNQFKLQYMSEFIYSVNPNEVSLYDTNNLQFKKEIDNLQTFYLQKLEKLKFVSKRFLIIHFKIIRNVIQKNNYRLLVIDTFNNYESVIDIYFDFHLYDFEMKESILFLLVSSSDDTNQIKYSNSLMMIQIQKLSNSFIESTLFESGSKKSDYEIQNYIFDTIKSRSEYEITKIEVINLLDSLMTHLFLINELQIMILFSKYGVIKFYHYSTNCQLEPFYEFNYSSHLVEISVLISQYENKEDLMRIFERDIQTNFLQTYMLYDILKIPLSNTKHFEGYMFILILNFGIMTFKLKEDIFTGIRVIKFSQQLTFDCLMKSYISHKLQDNILNVHFQEQSYTFKYEKEKFIALK